MPLTALDLFCGAGGWTLGLKRAGIEVVGAVEKDDLAWEAYHRNFPSIPRVGREIMEVGTGDLPQTDIIVGSPPCTAFSSARHYRTEAEKRRAQREGMVLVHRFLEVVRERRPRYWVGENVPSVPTKQTAFGRRVLPSWVNWTILNAADFGVPQIRKRAFFGKFPRPKPTHAERPDPVRGRLGWDTAENALNLRHIGAWSKVVLSDQQTWRTADGWAPFYTVLRGPSRTQTSVPQTLFLEEERGTDGVPGDAEDPIPSGWGFSPVTETDAGKLREKFHLVGRIWERHLSIDETKILMGFPQRHQLTGRTDQQFVQLGNAVCPPVAEAFGRAFVSTVEGPPKGRPGRPSDVDWNDRRVARIQRDISRGLSKSAALRRAKLSPSLRRSYDRELRKRSRIAQG